MNSNERGPGAPASPPRPACKPTGSVRLFDHTADVGLAIHGATLEDLFTWAAAGFARVAFRPAYRSRPLERGVAAPGPVEPGGAAAGPAAGRPATREVALGPAPDVEALLVAWLNHLIFILETEGRAVRSCQLRIAEGAPLAWTLRGTLTTTPVGPGEVAVAVKAATYHGLEVARQTREGETFYTARVILDV